VLSLGWEINTLGGVLLEEFVHGVNFKHMFVFLKFVGEITFNLSEDWLFTSSFSSFEFLSKERDGVEGILMFFELHNKELVGFTSGDVKLDEGSVDIFESSSDPFKMGFGVSDFVFDPFSVSGGGFSDVSVHVSNSC
jgi:hypothetical protein